MMIENNTNRDLQPNPSLPVELILEILLWLPVLTLLKCRSVCKLWLSLISSPNFIRTHLLKSIETSQFADRSIIACPFTPPFNKINVCSVNTLLNEPSCKAVAVDSPMKDPGMMVWVVGSCNGLICLASVDYKLFLWNPATRKSKELQNSEMMSSDFFEYYEYSKTVYGFGYDENNDDYKVVGIFCFRDTYTKKVKIYSSRLDCWRSIADFPSETLLTPLLDSGKFVNGALHWDGARDEFNSMDSWIIVSLDLKTEEYGEVVQPKYVEGSYYLVLGVLETSLCVLCNYKNIRADIWVMKEYGVTESWTKLVSIPYMSEPRPPGYSVPLCISASGDIMLEFEYGIVVYNFKDCRFKNYRSKDTVITKFRCYKPHTYIESLVSPNV